MLANHATQLVVPFGLFAVPAAAPGHRRHPGLAAGQRQLLLAEPDHHRAGRGRLDGRLLDAVLPVDPPATLAEMAGWQQAAVVAVAVLVAASVQVVANLLGRRQLMNASFDPLRLVNTYGAFGAVTQVRREVVLEGTDDPAPARPPPGGSTRSRLAGRPAPPLPARSPPTCGSAMLWFAAIAAPPHPWMVVLVTSCSTTRPPEAARPQPVPPTGPRPSSGPAVPLPLHHPGRAPPGRRLVVPRPGGGVPAALRLDPLSGAPARRPGRPGTARRR